MRAIRRKMESRTGASITFALLLFLVCAILSSVIIVAATTASGRMSRLAATDQRYYAVTSAAELLKDLMEDKSVALVTLTTSHSTVTYTDGVPGSPTDTDLVTEEYLIADFSKKEAAEIDVDSDLPADCMVRGGSSLQNDSVQNAAGYALLKGKAIDNKAMSLTSTLKRGKPQADPLAVSIEADFAASGSITFTVSNTGENPFSQELVLHANVSNSTYSTSEDTVTDSSEWTEEEEGDPPVEIMHSSETVVTETITIELTTLTWEA